jgi:hypothetical protein
VGLSEKKTYRCRILDLEQCVRSENDSSYRPGNLTFVGADLAPGYQKKQVVSPAPTA